MTKRASQRGRSVRGHRSVPHTADLRIEAWGPTREDCIAEAVRGLVESFADVRPSRYQRAYERHLVSDSDTDLVVAALDEVIYRLDAHGEIPASVEVSRTADGGIDLKLLTVGANAAQLVGAAPKAASMSGLNCSADQAGQWSCTITVDV